MRTIKNHRFWSPAIIVMLLIFTGFIGCNKNVNLDHSDNDNMSLNKTCILDGMLYEFISYKDEIQGNTNISGKEILQWYGINAEATEKLADRHLGEAWDTDFMVSLNDYEHQKCGEIYSIKGRDGQSVLLLKQDTEVEYIIFCNLLDSRNQAIPLEELLLIHGINSYEEIMNVAKKDRTVNAESLHILKNAFASVKSVVTSDEFDKEIATKVTERAQQELGNKLADEYIEINIMESTEKYIRFGYYPSIGYFESHLCYYKLSDEMRVQMEMFMK